MLQITEQQAAASAHSGLHGVAQTANKTLAITSKLTIIVASAATSMVESGAMLHCWWQPNSSVDLDHACGMWAVLKHEAADLAKSKVTVTSGSVGKSQVGITGTGT